METVPIEKQAFTLTEFCARHGINRHKAYEEIQAGRLASYMLGNKRMVSRAAADQWQAALEKKAAPVKGRPGSIEGRIKPPPAPVPA